jgi:TRAP-type C4-dicarboxylate transport system permease small subunit
MLRSIESVLVGLAIVCVAALCILITAGVFTRSLLAWGIPDSIIFVRELMVGAIVLPLAAVSASRSHIAVEFLFNRFPPRVQAWLVAFASLFGCIALLPILIAGWRELAHTVTAGSYFFGDLQLPKWPGRAIFLLGMAVFMVRMMVLAVTDLLAAIHGKAITSAEKVH